MKRLLKIIIAILFRLKFARKCKFNPFSVIMLNHCSFEGNNRIGQKTYINKSQFGRFSYAGFSCEFSNCFVGRFVSIGNNVRVISGNHPADLNVSTHPVFYSNNKSSFSKRNDVIEHLTTNNGFECEIGNDVWIGDNVLIKGGITIGDGAIIGMGSIVLDDVPPFAVVAGVPAKLIRYRFNNTTIKRLLEIKWWNKPIDWIKKHSESFCDCNLFLESVEREERYE